MRYKTVKIMTLRVCESNPGQKRATVHHAGDVKEILTGFFTSVQDDQERLVILNLDNKNHVLGLNVVHVGGQNYSGVDLACVFRHVLVSGGEAFIVAHNHPGGDPNPSQEDKTTANILILGAKTVGLRLLDFIIIGDETGDMFSFCEQGLL